MLVAEPKVEEDKFVEPPAKQKFPWSRPRKTEVHHNIFDINVIFNLFILKPRTY